MAAPDRSLAGLRARALDRAEMTNTTYPNVQRLNEALNEGYSRLWNVLAIAGGGELLAGPLTDITTVSGTEKYAMSSLPLKVLRVMERDDADTYKRIRTFDYDDLPDMSSPSGSQTVRIIAVAQVTTLDTDTATIDARIPAGWEQYVALHGAQYLIMKEERNTKDVIGERELIKAEIIETMTPRDLAEADAIRDVNRWLPKFNKYGDGVSVSQLRYRLEGSNLRLAEVKR